MKVKEVFVTCHSRKARKRAREVRKDAVENIIAMLMSWVNALPERLYKGALDVMTRTIILCLFIGALLVSLTLFALVCQWCWGMMMPPGYL